MKVHPVLRILRTLLLTGVAACLLLYFYQSRLIYYPQRYAAGEVEDFLSAEGRRLDYSTREGRQSAWLIAPTRGRKPERLWIVTGGNGSTALDFVQLPVQAGLGSDAFVLVDYPGYGVCEGKPHPRTIRESLQTLRPLLETECGLEPGELAEKGIVWGHSLGAAAALIAAEEYGIRRAVLLSPFTSTMDMTRHMFGFSLAWLVSHRFDNTTALTQFVQKGGRAWILHGTQDEVIPVTMGRGLARQGGSAVHFTEIPAARHNTILATALPEVSQSMASARKP